MRPLARIAIPLSLLAATLGLTACGGGGSSTSQVDRVEVEASHTPIIATDTQQVTVTAEADTDANEFWTFLFVDGSLEEICDSQASCSVTVGPLSSSPVSSTSTGRPVNYQAILLPINYDQCALSPCNAEDVNTFGVTDGTYTYQANSGNYIPALSHAPSSDAVDVVFHMASGSDEYTTGSDLTRAFINDVEDKIYEEYGRQAIIREHLDDFNFWVYTVPASTNDCGTPDSSISSNMPFRDADAVLHVQTFGDCSKGSRFTAEGHDTKAFLHESGHGVFNMADEYDGPTYYFEPDNEPNIFDTESNCTTEQNNKGRSTSACSQFTSRQGGWYKIHTGRTVMSWGDTGDAWDTEGEEHMNWFFNNL
ncbi:hypothetical protein H0Z60_01745 [Ectothiorhodospiraceae bacterium WFHF3C12]|nr:hypothetical protein [Ectothiorhodospiraceae bacterium WFHF3C12]